RASAANLAGAAPGWGAAAVPAFVADRRYPEARTAARAAAARGAAILDVALDPTGVYESLDLSLRSSAFAIAGLTASNALFVIERLAWEHGLRTLYRGMHARAAGGSVEHELLGSTPIRRADLRSTPGWAAALGRALVEWSPDPRIGRQVQLSQTVPGAQGS